MCYMWVHNAYVDLGGEKMSKSLGNVCTIRELLGRHRGEVLRFALLSAHYRSPLSFSESLLDRAETALSGFYTALRAVREPAFDTDVALEGEPFYRALCDDLNTPLAISELHALARALNKASAADKPALKARLLAAGQLLGILNEDPDAWLQGASSRAREGLSAEAIDALLAQRSAARAERDYVRADEIRDTLTAAGIALEDGPQGTRWRRA